MKFYELSALVTYLKRFKKIFDAERIDDNVLRILFDHKIAIGFDLSRGASDLFLANDLSPLRPYHAPFDTMLKKRLQGVFVTNVTMPGNDKIIRIETTLQGAYKAQKTSLQLEFTGRHTNAILLDAQNHVLEALRHVDDRSSYRIVMPGMPLLPLKPYQDIRKKGSIEDVASWLEERALRRKKNRLKRLKQRHATTLTKKIERLDKELRNLPDPKELQSQAQQHTEWASIVLAHLHEIKPYDKKLETTDFDGHPITIALPTLSNPKRIGDYFFNRAKRLEAKARNLHIEEENLKSRISFYRRLLQNLQSIDDENQIALLFPPKQIKRHKKTKMQCELFQIGNYRLMVGRNERENAWILKQARAGDWWFHLKDRPSAHCILQNIGRRQLPQEIIEKAARICVESSVTQPGDYLVDYTQRRNVKIVQGSHVNYISYKTVKIRKP